MERRLVTKQITAMERKGEDETPKSVNRSHNNTNHAITPCDSYTDTNTSCNVDGSCQHSPLQIIDASKGRGFFISAPCV